jgi:EAL domain-containing protein (putative c-di-GMP-specific phosphodiesterase class I)/predicted protein tyrosine phosphatase
VLEREQFLLYVQPIVPTHNTRAGGVHFEVLLRWQEPDGRIHVPAEFISAAERFRMGPRIDRYVIDATLRWLERNPQAAKSVTSCGINLSGATLTDEHFADYLADAPAPQQLPGAEPVPGNHRNQRRPRSPARAALHRADARPRLPLRAGRLRHRILFVRLPQRSRRRLHQDRRQLHPRASKASPLSQAVVRSIGDIAHVIGKSTIAEQVETEAEHRILQEMQVDLRAGIPVRTAAVDRVVLHGPIGRCLSYPKAADPCHATFFSSAARTGCAVRTAEQVFANWPGIETSSAGLNHDAESGHAELLRWADIIFVMERAHRSKLSSRSSRTWAARRGLPGNTRTTTSSWIRTL